MAHTEIRALIERYFAAIDAGQFEELATLFSPGYVVHFDGMPAMNAEGVVPFIAGFFTAFPDLQHRVEEILVDGDRAAARITISGTHQGELMGVPPTRRPVSFGAVNIFHLADGCIDEHWVNADLLGMLQQIGAIPTPGA